MKRFFQKFRFSLLAVQIFILLFVVICFCCKWIYCGSVTTELGKLGNYEVYGKTSDLHLNFSAIFESKDFSEKARTYRRYRLWQKGNLGIVNILPQDRGFEFEVGGLFIFMDAKPGKEYIKIEHHRRFFKRHADIEIHLSGPKNQKKSNQKPKSKPPKAYYSPNLVRNSLRSKSGLCIFSNFY